MRSKTVVKGIRASREFFYTCDLVAKAEGINRNKLIVRVMSEYCDNIMYYSKKVVEHHKTLIKADLVEEVENDEK